MIDKIAAREAKAIVVIAFRNGPIEDVHAGKTCPTCVGNPEYSHITDVEMKNIMKNAVDHVYALLMLRDSNPDAYAANIMHGLSHAGRWDDPEPVRGLL